MGDLFRSMSRLNNLQTFHLPRASTQDEDVIVIAKYLRTEKRWPPNLRELHVSGGIRPFSFCYLNTIPSGVTSLTIKDAPHLTLDSIMHFLDQKGSQLRQMEILAPIPKLADAGGPSLYEILNLTPNLTKLKISTDFIFQHIMGPYKECMISLRSLYLDCFDPANNKGFYDDLWMDIMNGRLSTLRKLGLHRGLGWHESHPEHLSFLNKCLQDRATEDGPGAAISPKEAGVIIFVSKKEFESRRLQLLKEISASDSTV